MCSTCGCASGERRIEGDEHQHHHGSDHHHGHDHPHSHDHDHHHDQHSHGHDHHDHDHHHHDHSHAAEHSGKTVIIHHHYYHQGDVNHYYQSEPETCGIHGTARERITSCGETIANSCMPGAPHFPTDTRMFAL